MAGRLLALSASTLSRVPKFPIGSASCYQHSKAVVGNRDVVGFGINGEPTYDDRSDFPMPAIRWKETSKDILVIRIK